jgi:thiol-disulfide isomerase/thioredoxin
LNNHLKAGEAVADVQQLKGKWRGIFQTATGGEVPFNFEVLEQGGKLSVVLLNAAERYQAGEIRLNKDSVFVDLQMFDNELALQLTGSGVLSGVLRRQDGKGSPLPVRAVKGVSYRFLEHGTVPVKNISGRYDVVFSPGTSREEKAVAVLKQEGNRVFGSFLRITGDSRYLEGLIEGDELQLSSFIGSSPAYYKARVKADGSLQGENLGLRSTGTPFVATFNERAALPDAFTLTDIREKEQRFAFNFPDASGKLVGIDDERFNNKPLIIAIGGTWCPNCMDEASFLGKWYKDNAGKGIEVIGLQFERDTSLSFVKNTFTRFSKRYGINYPLLLGGVADKQVVIQKLPVLANFISFPTTIFLDRNKNVKKIHTGFSGPATGKDYDLFVKEFNEIAADLLK